MKGQLLTYHDAKRTKVQHHSPCSDCPWARKSLRGWLGNYTAEEWIEIVRADGFIECHTKIDKQCAGSAIFRSNICKSPRDPKVLTLPRNTISVFANIGEFLNHHLKTTIFDYWGRKTK